MQLIGVRDYVDSTVTLGTLSVGTLLVQTLELPWHPMPGLLCGEPNRSCIPAGTYSMERHDTIAHPKTWALVNHALGLYHEPDDIPPGCAGRSACLIHTANFVNQLEGCIGIGHERITMKFPWPPNTGSWYIGESMLAMDDLQEILPWTNDHLLTLSYATGVTP